MKKKYSLLCIGMMFACTSSFAFSERLCSDNNRDSACFMESDTIDDERTTIGGFDVREADIDDDEVKVFDVVDEMPQFPGGQQALFEYLSQNITYPEKAEKDGTEGKVYIKFCIKYDGSVSDVLVLKSVSPECDAEALRVVKAMPKWKPGKQNGRCVNVWYTLPVVFKLHGEDSELTGAALVSNIVSEIKGILPTNIFYEEMILADMSIEGTNVVFHIIANDMQKMAPEIAKFENTDSMAVITDGLEDIMAALCSAGYGMKLQVKDGNTLKPYSSAVISAEMIKNILDKKQQMIDSMTAMDVCRALVSNLTTPMKIDDNATLAKVYIDGSEVFFIYTAKEKIDDEESLKADLTYGMKSMGIADNEARRTEIAEKKITIHHIFKDSEGKVLTNILITPDDLMK